MHDTLRGKGLHRCDYVKVLEVGGVSRIIQAGLMEPRGSSWEGQSGRGCDKEAEIRVMCWKMEEGAISREWQWPQEAGKGEETDSSIKSPKGPIPTDIR